MRILAAIIILPLAVAGLHLSRGEPLPWTGRLDTASPATTSPTSLRPAGLDQRSSVWTVAQSSPILVHARELGPSDAFEVRGAALLHGAVGLDSMRPIRAPAGHDAELRIRGVQELSEGVAESRRAAVLAALALTEEK
mgnify:CR=1 FL=1